MNVSRRTPHVAPQKLLNTARPDRRIIWPGINASYEILLIITLDVGDKLFEM